MKQNYSFISFGFSRKATTTSIMNFIEGGSSHYELIEVGRVGKVSKGKVGSREDPLEW